MIYLYVKLISDSNSNDKEITGKKRGPEDMIDIKHGMDSGY